MTAGGDRDLVDRVRRSVGDGLSDAAEGAGATGGVLGGEDRRMLAHRLIRDELQRIDAFELHAGREPLSETDRSTTSQSYCL